MPDLTLIERAIEELLQVQKRPAMYFYPAEGREASTFLSGFRTGVQSAGLPRILDLWLDVSATHGYVMGEGVESQMRRKGLDEAAIVTELIEIEIETLRRLAARPQKREA